MSVFIQPELFDCNYFGCLTDNNLGFSLIAMNTIGKRLKLARKRAGLTQVQLAEKSGVSQQMISKLEREISNATSDIVKLSRGCGVDADWLEDGDVNTPPWLLTGQGQREGGVAHPAAIDATSRSLATTTPTARSVIERIVHAASTGELNDEAMKALGKAAEQMRKSPQVSANDYHDIPTTHNP